MFSSRCVIVWFNDWTAQRGLVPGQERWWPWKWDRFSCLGYYEVSRSRIGGLCELPQCLSKESRKYTHHHHLGTIGAAFQCKGKRSELLDLQWPIIVVKYLLKDLELLRKIYHRVEDIDLIVGAIAELPQNDSLIGQTFSCIIGESKRFNRSHCSMSKFWR